MNTNLPRRDRTSLHTYSKLKIQTRTKQDQAIETKPTTNRNLTICCQDQLHSPRNRGDDSSLSYEPRENSPPPPPRKLATPNPRMQPTIQTGSPTELGTERSRKGGGRRGLPRDDARISRAGGSGSGGGGERSLRRRAAPPTSLSWSPRRRRRRERERERETRSPSGQKDARRRRRRVSARKTRREAAAAAGGGGGLGGPEVSLCGLQAW